MENQSTPTTRFGRFKAFASANQMLLFLAGLLLVSVGIIVYLGVGIGTLQHDNALMREILRPECPCDSTYLQP